jgi:hypothetical protein
VGRGVETLFEHSSIQEGRERCVEVMYQDLIERERSSGHKPQKRPHGADMEKEFPSKMTFDCLLNQMSTFGDVGLAVSWMNVSGQCCFICSIILKLLLFDNI